MADTKQYWLTIAKDAGLSEDQTKALEAAVANDKFANAFVPRPEYSRSLDAETQKYRDLVAQNETYYRTEAQRAAENQRKVDESLAQAQRYRDLYGDLEGSGKPAPTTPQFDPANYISAGDHKKEMERLEAQTLYVIEKGLECSNDYRDRFGKSLSIPQLKKFAVENQLPIDVAYQKMIQPEVEAKQSASFAEQLKAARAEGAADALSRANVPIDTRSKEASPFLSNALKPVAKDAASLSDSDRVNSFAEAWNQAGTAKS